MRRGGSDRPGKLSSLEENDVEAFAGEDGSGVASAGAAANDENLGMLEEEMSMWLWRKGDGGGLLGSLQRAWLGQDSVGRIGEQRAKHKYMGRGEDGAVGDKSGVTGYISEQKGSVI